jgi:hypothetical protein
MTIIVNANMQQMSQYFYHYPLQVLEKPLEDIYLHELYARWIFVNYKLYLATC